MTQLAKIAAAMLAALNDSGRPAGVPLAKRWTGLALEPQDLPARTFGWTEMSVERAGSPTSRLASRAVEFSVQDLVAGTGANGQTAQEICEACCAWSVMALEGNRYLDAGEPLAIDTVEVGASWEFEQAEIPVCRCTHRFRVTFTTRANDAELRA